MSEYIERDKLGISRCNPEVFEDKGYAKGWNAVIDIIQSAPAADVQTVVRGRWKDAMQSCHDSPHVKCSVCGEYYWRYFNKFNFCPNCGADMRKESNNV